MTTPPYPEGRQRPPYGRLPRVYAQPGGYEPPEPPRRGTVGALVVTAVVLVLIAVGVGVFVVGADDSGRPTPETLAVAPSEEESAPGPADAAVGDCLRVNDADAADVDLVDCADPSAVYQVAVRRDSSAERCPAPSYVSYTQEGTLRLCLMLNARQGECFAEDEHQDARVDCAAPEASYRVARVVVGAADPDECGTAHAPNAVVYPEPGRTLCRVPMG